MNDQSAQNQTQQANSYVDDYTPPATNISGDSDSDMPVAKDDGMFTQSFTDDTNNTSNDQNSQTSQDDVFQDDTASNTDSTVTPVIAADDDEYQGADDDMGSDLASDEDIETQNIFFMLGVEEGDDDLKEKFLDQLQEVIWDDFLTNDVELLLTQDEFAEFKTQKEKADTASGDTQEEAKDALVEYLEGLIPDLEDIMLEKALDLKADLFVERVNSMKQLFAQKPEELDQIARAEQLMYEDKWKSSATLLNGIKE